MQPLINQRTSEKCFLIRRAEIVGADELLILRKV